MDVEELMGIEEESPAAEQTVYELFKWSVLIKGAISLAEVIVGTALLIIPPARIVPIVQGVGARFSSHADSVIIGHILNELARFSSGAAFFVAIYLLSRGLIKVALIVGLLRGVLWTYPVSLVVLGLFLIYQTYQIVTAGSIFVIGITLFDIVVIYFIWREWKIVRRRKTH